MKVELNPKQDNFGGYGTDSSFFTQNFGDFTNEAAGRLCIAIGEGKFRQELYNVIIWAHAKGMKRQFDMLIEDHKRTQEEKKRK